jgi:hypothetical protein
MQQQSICIQPAGKQHIITDCSARLTFAKSAAKKKSSIKCSTTSPNQGVMGRIKK